MSPRAACRLAQLGWTAYDYAAGKADWLAFGLPHEGTAQLISGLVNDDVPTCQPSETLSGVRNRLETSRFGIAVVTSPEGVVVGRLDRDALEGDLDGPVERAMTEGPTTVRPSEDTGELAERMRHAGVDGVLVTRSDGTLVGMIERHRVEQATAEGTG